MRFARVLLALVVLATFIAGGSPAAAQTPQAARPADGEGVLVEVRPSNAIQLESAGFDVWGANADRSLIVVDPPGWDALTTAGYDLRVVRRYPPSTGRQAAATTFGPGSYHGYDAVVAELQAIQAAHPDIVTLSDRGPSWETTQGRANRRIWAAKVTGPATGSAKPVVMYLSTYHAREIVVPELALKALHLFVDDYGRDPLLTNLVNTREIWIVPLVNPDGWNRVEQGAQWWRKNADGPACGSPNPGVQAGSATPGVDLNRNHPYQWGRDDGSSPDPCGETYRGSAAASEPETQAVQTLIGATRPSVLITWHSYGNDVLWPWGYTTSAGYSSGTASASPVLDALGGRMAALTGYTGGPASSTLYLTSGDVTDWAWATYATAGFTIEVGDWNDGAAGNPFAPPYAAVGRFWDRNRPAALYLARVADAPTRAYGPDPGQPTVTAPPGQPATITVALAAGLEPAPGSPTPTAAELFVDAPGADGTGLAGAVAFGGASATWTLASGLVSSGTHSVYVRAKDAAGHWGPLNAVSAAFGRTRLLLPIGPQHVRLVG